MRAVLLLVLLLRTAAAEDAVGCVHGYLTKYNTPVQPYSDAALVYFLHVPRTAGRTFHSCFLKLGTLPQRRCPKAYDHLRMDVHAPSCNLLSSHDDFSIVGELPRNVAVITQLRDPLDRVLSAYEFATEVAARTLKRPEGYKKKEDRIATEDVWPWSHLVPLMSQDLKERAEQVKQQHDVSKTDETGQGNWVQYLTEEGAPYFYNYATKESKWNLTAEEQELLLPELDPYDNSLVMPLKEFVEHPVVYELLHNGGYLQVMGLTNYSRWSDAAMFRHCALHEGMRDEFLQIAKQRLHSFAHVGTTDKLHESIAAAAGSINLPLNGLAYVGAETPPGDKRGLQDDADGGEEPVAADSDGGGPAEGSAGPGEASLRRLPKDLMRRVANSRGQVRSAEQSLRIAQQAQLQAARDAYRQRTLNAVDGGEEVRSRLERNQAPARKLQAIGLDGPEQDAKLQDEEVDSSAAPGDVPTQEGRNLQGQLPYSLGEEYHRCVQRAAKRNKQRKRNSLANLRMPDGRVVNFSKETRKLIPETLLQRIRSLNAMDIELHSYALQLLDERRQSLSASGLLRELPPASAVPMGSGRHRQLPRQRGGLPDEPRDEL